MQGLGEVGRIKVYEWVRVGCMCGGGGMYVNMCGYVQFNVCMCMCARVFVVLIGHVWFHPHARWGAWQ